MQLISERRTLPGSATLAAGLPTLAIYTVTMFLSATLLFAVEPMFARMVLPRLGGSPAVWNTTVVVYQALLLVGYGYAHLTARLLGVRGQAALHVAILLLPLLVLPIHIPGGWNPPTGGSPILWLLGVLTVAVGLPFFVVSASSPLLQSWFARSGHASAGDPYFLYAASNVGSMLALLAYPTVIEPHLRLAQQSHIWAVAYGALVLLMAACAFLVSRHASAAEAAPVPPVAEDVEQATVNWSRRLRWIAFAFVPSSLMLSVTTYLTTSIAPIPLLWVLPLAIYLLTFILVFSKRTVVPRSLLVRALPLALLPLVVSIIAQLTRPLQILIPLHIVTFFVAAMLCHGALADDRPSPSHLTEFFLCMSVGGVLGGLFTALVAPLVFTGVAEYPLALVAVCVLQAGFGELYRTARRWTGLLVPAGVAALTAGLLLALRALVSEPNPAFVAMFLCVPAIACFSISRRRATFTFATAGLLIAGGLFGGVQGDLLHAERSFYGIIRITRVSAGSGAAYNEFLHSGTLHGLQSLDPARRDEPLTYYYPTGPIGQVFTTADGAAGFQHVGIVGLGTGSLACYARPGQQWTFYEIDPAVVRVARDPRYFTFLRDCAPNAAMVLGDARLSLHHASPAAYDLLVLDAYSSDSVPVHLLTREALSLYLDKLSAHGVLAFHISNRYLDLRPVLGNLAHTAGLVGAIQNDVSLSAEDAANGKVASQWVLMARSGDDLQRVATDPRWQPLRGDPTLGTWSDDFSSILSVFRWR